MELTNEELNERVALLKKFRALLEQQRNKFQEYLTVLEKQQVVKNIANLQKVIVPMTRMYKAANQNMPNSDQESITKIQNDLNDLQNKVLNQNKINRDLLRVHIDSIRQQIQNFKNPYKTNRSVYSQKQPVAQLVEVDA